MGVILPSYKEAILNDVLIAVSSNAAQYYAFAANPIAYANGVPTVTTDDYSAKFTNDWQLMFGKLLTNTNMLPVILNSVWTTNTVYTMYDNTVANLSNYYVITNPSEVGGDYWVFKCIDNANGAVSVEQPDQVQLSTFYKADGHGWSEA